MNIVTENQLHKMFLLIFLAVQLTVANCLIPSRVQSIMVQETVSFLVMAPKSSTDFSMKPSFFTENRGMCLSPQRKSFRTPSAVQRHGCLLRCSNFNSDNEGALHQSPVCFELSCPDAETMLSRPNLH